MTLLDVLVTLAALAFGFYAGRLERRSRSGAFRCPGCGHDKSFHSDVADGFMRECNHSRESWGGNRTTRCGCRSTKGELEELAFRVGPKPPHPHAQFTAGIVTWNPGGPVR